MTMLPPNNPKASKLAALKRLMAKRRPVEGSRAEEAMETPQQEMAEGQ